MAKKSSTSRSTKPRRPMTYAGSGVDIEAGDQMVGRIEQLMRRTYGPRVLGKHGAFAGCFRLDYNEKLFARNYREPVLVACTDGVGTKVKLAAQMGIHHTVGRDLVAMNVNDLIVQGAEPLFFLDYIGTHDIEPAMGAAIVKGVADGCQLADCALLGGETAEMPDVYAEGDYDLAGFAVGVCELKRMIDGNRARSGDVLLGLGASGVHSNGFSLVRAIVKEAKLDLHQTYDELQDDRPLGEVLLEPTRIYARSVTAAQRSYKVKRVVTAMSHITGGGIPGNIPRMLRSDLDARINTSTWDVPPVFRFLQKHGNVEEKEMWRVFNMGLGFVMAIKPHFANAIADRLERYGETVYHIGKLTRGSGKLVMD